MFFAIESAWKGHFQTTELLSRINYHYSWGQYSPPLRWEEGITLLLRQPSDLRLELLLSIRFPFLGTAVYFSLRGFIVDSQRTNSLQENPGFLYTEQRRHATGRQEAVGEDSRLFITLRELEKRETDRGTMVDVVLRKPSNVDPSSRKAAIPCQHHDPLTHIRSKRPLTGWRREEKSEARILSRLIQVSNDGYGVHSIWTTYYINRYITQSPFSLRHPLICPHYSQLLGNRLV